MSQIGLQTHSYPYTPFGQMAIRNNTTLYTEITQSTPDTTLLPINIDTNYFRIENFNLEYFKSFELVNNCLQVKQSGIYRFGGWAAIRHEKNTATAGILFAVERAGNIVGFTPAPVPALMPNIGDVGLIAGEGLVSLEACDGVCVYIASDKAGDILVANCTITGLFISPY